MRLRLSTLKQFSQSPNPLPVTTQRGDQVSRGGMKKHNGNYNNMRGLGFKAEVTSQVVQACERE